jgi:hypothetical protein
MAALLLAGVYFWLRVDPTQPITATLPAVAPVIEV